MGADQVAAALGAPNIVTSDPELRPIWVYDRVVADTAYSTSAGGIGILVLGGATRDAASPSPRVFTVTVIFDADGRVRDFGYRRAPF